VTGGEIRSIEPTLSGKFHGAFFTPSDSTGDIHKFTRGLARACARRGVQFHYDTSISSVEQRADGRFTIVRRNASLNDACESAEQQYEFDDRRLRRSEESGNRDDAR
jgi:L-2-hydroxyglutarate oxidase LhgO